MAQTTNPAPEIALFDGVREEIEYFLTSYEFSIQPEWLKQQVTSLLFSNILTAQVSDWFPGLHHVLMWKSGLGEVLLSLRELCSVGIPAKAS